MGKIIKFVLIDLMKSKTIIAYTLLLTLLTWGIFALEDNSAKGILTLLNILLLTIPLVSIIFATTYIYNSAEFILLLVSQPIKRKKIWISIFAGLNLALTIAFTIGMGVPIFIFEPSQTGLMIYCTGLLITMVFVAIAMLSAVSTKDKARGIGNAIMLWLFFAILFDAIILFVLFQFAEYPIEEAMIAVTLFSPIDIARILILLQMDISAMLGYTGAIFKSFFGTPLGLFVAFMMLVLWSFIPFALSLQKFNKKDL